MPCYKCGHWASETARQTTKGKRWCKELNTWTPAGFGCDAYDEMLMHDAPGEWYTIAEVAEKCHVSEGTVRYWIQTERLKAYPVASDEVKFTGQFKTQWHIDKAIADRYAEWYNDVVER